MNARYDRMLWSNLTGLRFTHAGTDVLILGTIGVGNTHLATARVLVLSAHADSGRPTSSKNQTNEGP